VIEVNLTVVFTAGLPEVTEKSVPLVTFTERFKESNGEEPHA
jgi:hypothetical protein